MVKRALELQPVSSSSKRTHLEPSLSVLGAASPEAAAAADAHPPLGELLRILPKDSPETGAAVAYWMRMEDMRSENTLPSDPRLLISVASL